MLDPPRGDPQGGLAGGGGLGEGEGVGGGGWGRGGGQGTFHPPCHYCTITWCFALKGLRTIRHAPHNACSAHFVIPVFATLRPLTFPRDAWRFQSGSGCIRFRNERNEPSFIESEMAGSVSKRF